ncbi:MAG: diguanylate cyclase [Bacillales bacterium]|nr:diguanylate cyclase [Bacillales bacterium]
MMNERIIYSIAALIVLLIDLVLGILSLKERGKKGITLSISCFCTILVIAFYTPTIFIQSKELFSVLSSIYFICMDFLAIFFFIFASVLTGYSKRKFFKIFIIFSIIMTNYEIGIFIGNIFNNFAIGYIPVKEGANAIAYFNYDMHLFYYIHLGFTYFTVLLALIYLGVKAINVPFEYRSQYLIIIYTILTVIIANAFFLYFNGAGGVDLSIFCFSIACYASYYSSFKYSKGIMLNHLKSSIFENIDQGILLFDNENNLILSNDKVRSFFKNIPFSSSLTLNAFCCLTSINISKENENKSCALQIYVKSNNDTLTLRCDYRLLTNKKGSVLGKLFVFANVSIATDVLTTFHNWELFRRFINDNPNKFFAPTSIGICDINKLGLYNNVHGKQAGDQLIKQVAEKMKEIFSQESYFVRGHEANLIVLCYNQTQEYVESKMEELCKFFNKVSIQYATAYYDDNSLPITNKIEEAYTSLKSKKLLDSQSSKSSVIASLLRTLKECDDDLDNHIRRTSTLGKKLGERLNLTSSELTDLSLLCLLHDIGKIGIPLELLNKPASLTKEEFEIMKTHVEKGYHIANSIPELKKIAELIYCHHERWDGKGYPNGLNKDSIPLLSRIIALVDAFDAMTNDRPYREAMSVSEAKEEIRRCSGTQFDPKLASEFISLINDEYADIIASDQVQPSEIVPTSEIQQNINKETVSVIEFASYTLNENNQIISIGDNFTELTGYTKDDINKGNISQFDLIPEEDRFYYIYNINILLKKHNIAFLEHRLQKKDHSIIHVLCIGRVYFDPVTKKEHSQILITNSLNTYSSKLLAESIERKTRNIIKKWEKKYHQDPLTGLLNHSAFQTEVESLLLNGKIVVMVMADVDFFKSFNDTYGHHSGDKFLVSVARSITAFIKKEDLACRMGGDEFAFTISFEKDEFKEEELRSFINKLYHSISMTLKTKKPTTTVSLGIAVSDNSITFNQLYEKADKALYHSKQNGRSQITYYHDINPK